MAKEIDLYSKDLYINREISWLGFNRRVLAEANDRSNPLLERVKFLAICAGNLDEFFMIRMSGLIAQTKTGLMYTTPDYMEPRSLVELLEDMTEKLIHEYDLCWKELTKELFKEGIKIRKMEDISADQRAWVSNFYKSRVHPLLTPLALDISHPFPFISNNSMNLALKLFKNGETKFARVKVPTSTLSRFIEIPSNDGNEYVILEDIIKHNAYQLFQGMEVQGAYMFSISRNADVKVTIDEACDLLMAVEGSLEGRELGFPVIMTVEKSMPNEMKEMFGKNLKLSLRQIFDVDSILSLVDLWQLHSINRADLKEASFVPHSPPEFSDDESIFAAIKKKDWILYHPYESFNTILKLIKDGSMDPAVQSIKICLYRIGKDPSIAMALRHAREQGKTVSVLMELRAKFDEINNIKWARELESIGVHVVYGPVDLKVHSKLLQIVRLEGNSLVRYTHMSSGNYNTNTAKQYGDISFLTANQEIGDDVGELFNALTGFFGPRVYKHLLVAPLTIKSGLIAKIDREIEHVNSGKSGYIAFKSNGLIDADIIATLYRASMAGVKIDLNIRGLCCLRPGIAGISDNITVTSVVDRFLEHARIYYFENAGNPEMYMGSSDMMPRNLMARVETLFPILDEKMLKMIKNNILDIHLNDNVKAKKLCSDGSSAPVVNDRNKIRSQQWLIDNRGCWHE